MRIGVEVLQLLAVSSGVGAEVGGGRRIGRRQRFLDVGYPGLHVGQVSRNIDRLRETRTFHHSME
jgi:hypothetical protein